MLDRLRALKLRLRALFSRDSLEAELDDEIRFHIDMETEANVRRGMHPEDARRAARLAFGGTERFKERTREARGTRLLEDTVQDVRYSLRVLRRSPGFTAGVVLTLAVGIGGSTAIFSVINNTLLRPMMIREVGRLVRLDDVAPGSAGPGDGSNISPLNIEAIRERATVFESVSVQQYRPFVLTGSGEPLRLRGVGVSEGWLSTLGIQPIRGRGFTTQEHRRGDDADVALIGYGLWQRRFGGAPGVIGRSLVLNGRARTVVGVMPRGFRFPYEGEVWVPLEYDRTNGAEHYLLAFGRLEEGVALEEARSELTIISNDLAREYPATNSGWVIAATALRENLVRGYDETAIALLSVVGFLLLLGCLNVANLMLARAVYRRREMALRAALGAGRGRRFRQIAVESLVLAAAGGALGLLLTLLIRPYLSHLVPPVMSVELAQDEIVLDFRIAGFVTAVSLLAGLIAALAPVLRGSGADLRQTVNSGARSGGGVHRSRIGRLLIAAEVAFALILLIGAGGVVVGFLRTASRPLGFEPEEVLTMRLSLPSYRYEPWERPAIVNEIIRESEAVTGVRSASIGTGNPLLPSWTTSLVPEGRATDDDAAANDVNLRVVTPGYFRTLGIQLYQGRGFGSGDDSSGVAVAILSRAAARRIWPDSDPIGKRVRLRRADRGQRWLTIVGVAGDIREIGDIESALYLPYAQFQTWIVGAEVHLMARAQREPRSLIRPMESAIWSVDSDIPIFGAAQMSDVRSDQWILERSGAMLGAAFALFGILLAGLGVFGVIAYAVSQTRREWAVRGALGARPAQITGAILLDAARAVLLGVAVGLLGALALNRVIGHLLAHADGLGPGLCIALAALLTAVALAAAALPARAAGRLDPMIILRQE
jgi:putative ABC transport system permease protein